jgi:protein MpaA
MKAIFLDHSANGLPIPGYIFGRKGPEVLILGGVHGDEREGVEAAYGLCRRFAQSFPFNLRLTLIPAFNIDGVTHHSRLNGHGVDLNRNMATNDWSPKISNPRYHPGPKANSEPETTALIRWLDEHKPRFILSLHSWKPVLNVNGRCRPEAEAIAQCTRYPVEDSIGYPTPGCLGTYCGLEREMPTLTYEIERGLDTKSILDIHVPAICEALKVTEQIRSETL